MHFNSWRLAIVAIVMLGEIGAAYAQNAVEQLQQLWKQRRTDSYLENR